MPRPTAPPVRPPDRHPGRIGFSRSRWHPLFAAWTARGLHVGWDREGNRVNVIEEFLDTGVGTTSEPIRHRGSLVRITAPDADDFRIRRLGQTRRMDLAGPVSRSDDPNRTTTRMFDWSTQLRQRCSLVTSISIVAEGDGSPRGADDVPGPDATLDRTLVVMENMRVSAYEPVHFAGRCTGRSSDPFASRRSSRSIRGSNICNRTNGWMLSPLTASPTPSHSTSAVHLVAIDADSVRDASWSSADLAAHDELQRSDGSIPANPFLARPTRDAPSSATDRASPRAFAVAEVSS